MPPQAPTKKSSKLGKQYKCSFFNSKSYKLMQHLSPDNFMPSLSPEIMTQSTEFWSVFISFCSSKPLSHNAYQTQCIV